ncbi:hypothetical protein K491DRAFT_680639 [Lophiostoma macrostomum CBS 122681]|uniref:Uncharacterized protein n=1 Tax=Lophiostoma macrostomum CBS 122681 TaxID=1314788 RepID=A0A6A6T3H1_9PLEO|nr:hypothetical protein K491DRAFT_680639 [Lophiostoma macrostomum CBS 122681]
MAMIIRGTSTHPLIQPGVLSGDRPIPVKQQGLTRDPVTRREYCDSARFPCPVLLSGSCIQATIPNKFSVNARCGLVNREHRLITHGAGLQSRTLFPLTKAPKKRHCTILNCHYAGNSLIIIRDEFGAALVYPQCKTSFSEMMKVLELLERGGRLNYIRTLSRNDTIKVFAYPDCPSIRHRNVYSRSKVWSTRNLGEHKVVLVFYSWYLYNTKESGYRGHLAVVKTRTSESERKRPSPQEHDVKRR